MLFALIEKSYENELFKSPFKRLDSVKNFEFEKSTWEASLSFALSKTLLVTSSAIPF